MNCDGRRLTNQVLAHPKIPKLVSCKGATENDSMLAIQWKMDEECQQLLFLL